MKRQELHRVAVRKNQQKKSSQRRKVKFLSLQGSTEAAPAGEILLRYGFESIFVFSMLIFFLFCGADLPYKKMNDFYLPGLRKLEIPDRTQLEQMDIQSLKADIQVETPRQEGFERTQLWDVPHFRYTIHKNDTVSQISRHYNISMSTLLSLNKIANVKKMKVGEILIIPETDGILYTCIKGESLEDIINKFSLDKSELLKYNPYLTLINRELLVYPEQEIFIPGGKIPENKMREQMGELFVFPVQGSIIKGYGSVTDSVTRIETFHNGIDIGGSSGDAVKASLDGKVIAAGFNSSYGNYIIIEHSGGFRSLYAQLLDRFVLENDKVLQGEIIATVGTSGYAREPHLHFSLFKGKKSIDPMDYLN